MVISVEYVGTDVSGAKDVVKPVVWLVTALDVAVVGVVATGDLFEVVTFSLEVDGLSLVVCVMLDVVADEIGMVAMVVVRVVGDILALVDEDEEEWDVDSNRDDHEDNDEGYRDESEDENNDDVDEDVEGEKEDDEDLAGVVLMTASEVTVEGLSPLVVVVVVVAVTVVAISVVEGRASTGVFVVVVICREVVSLGLIKLLVVNDAAVDSQEVISRE